MTQNVVKTFGRRELTRGRKLCLGFADGTRCQAQPAAGGGAWVGQQAPGGYGFFHLRLCASTALQARLASRTLTGFGCGGRWYPLAWSPLEPKANAAQSLQAHGGLVVVGARLPAAYPVAAVAAAATAWQARQVAALAAVFPDWPQGLIAALLADTAAQVVQAGSGAATPATGAGTQPGRPGAATGAAATAGATTAPVAKGRDGVAAPTAWPQTTAVAPAAGTLVVRPGSPWWQVATPNQAALAWLPYATLARLQVTVAAADFWAGIAWLWWHVALLGVAPAARVRPR